MRPNAERYPLDGRFLQSPRNYIYYLIDREVPPVLREKQNLLEYDIDPILYKAGGSFLGEWSFLLNEAKHGFAQYPFFMISSRFYEKNLWLQKDLNAEWTRLFSYFQKYQWGYLPSYDRPLRWINLEWEKAVEKQSWRYQFFPFTSRTYDLTQQLFGVNIPHDYKYTADLFCNYVGFRDRDSLLQYVNFYRPLLDFFFNEQYELKEDLNLYVRPSGHFRNEKAFTFFLELLSHLFFFKEKQPYFALHYDGYYEVNERNCLLKRLEKFPLPLSQKYYRQLRWHWRKSNSEGIMAYMRGYLQRWKTVK